MSLSYAEEKRNEALAVIQNWRQNPTLPDPFDGLVQYKSGKFVTTSLEVAKRFGKQHKNVIRDIRKLQADLQDIEAETRMVLDGSNLSRLEPCGSSKNFILSSYTNEQGYEQPMYNITRDGFVLLTMGFTGKKALQWKLKFLETYNLMEQYIEAQTYVQNNYQELFKIFLGAQRAVGRSEIETYYFDFIQVNSERNISLAVVDLGDLVFLQFMWKDNIALWNCASPANLKTAYETLDLRWVDRGIEESSI